MDHIGIDVHKKDSQICILAEEGELLERRVRTEPGRFAEMLGHPPRARILIESATESEWVARCCEALGHEVIVASPNFAPMYAQRSRKVKTDRRDARALAEACVLGAYRRAHRLSDEQRHVRARLTVRDALVWWSCHSFGPPRDRMLPRREPGRCAVASDGVPSYHSECRPEGPAERSALLQRPRLAALGRRSAFWPGK
jgi:Transposase